MLRFENGGLQFDATISQSDIDAIAQYASQAQRIQTQHIIDLLKENIKCEINDDCHCRDCCNCKIIELIKGETK